MKFQNSNYLLVLVVLVLMIPFGAIMYRYSLYATSRHKTDELAALVHAVEQQAGESPPAGASPARLSAAERQTAPSPSPAAPSPQSRAAEAPAGETQPAPAPPVEAGLERSALLAYLGNDSGQRAQAEIGATSLSLLPQYIPLFRRNNDMVGWLSIADTGIDYPVMYTPRDQNYYLHLDFDRETSIGGMLFIGGPWYFGNNNTIIYGHNMKDGSMFGRLHQYADEQYGKAHARLRFDTLLETGTYELVGVFYGKVYPEGTESADAFCYYNYPTLADEADYTYYVQQVKAASLYDTGVTPEWGEQLLTLSTCSYYTDEGRFVVVARRVAE